MRHTRFILALFLVMTMISSVQSGVSLPDAHAVAVYGQLVSLNIEEIQFRELYAVEYRSYTEESIGTVTIQNQTGENLTVTVVLGGEKYVNAPMKMTANLPANQRTTILLHIDLDISVLDLSRQVEHIPISIEIAAYMAETEVFRSDVMTKYIALHDRHKIPDGDPSKIAKFVDPEDRYVVSEVSANLGTIGATAEEKAATAFKLLQKKGIYCIGSGGVQIQYPRELLKIRLGSIYDGSLLYAAILESLDVETKLMFGSDMMLPLYKYQSEWHPVDMNMLVESFEAACSSGRKLQSVMLAKDAHTTILREAWDKHPPLWFPVLASEDMPKFKSANSYIEENKLEDAAAVLNQLLEKYPNNSVLLNNSANVELLVGNVEQAVEKYTLAVSRSPDDGGLYLNMGIAYHRLGNKAKSMELIGKAHTKLGSYVAMHNMLNLDRTDEAYEEIDSLLKQASQSTGTSSVALAARSLTISLYPLYWKRFHK